MRARHRTSKLLMRQGIVWSGGTAWTGAHHTWLGQQRFELAGLQAAYDTTLEMVLLAQSRRDRLDKAIGEMAHEGQWWPVVSRLQCLRGVSTLTAFGLAVEVGDWTRFSGSTIGAYLGLVPTESSSGQGRQQGSITKTGNTHARRLLVEAAWHHRRPYRPTKTMRDRCGSGPGGGACPRARRQPAPARPVDALRGAQEADRDRERRPRPRARRLVLVTRDAHRAHRPGRASAVAPPGGIPSHTRESAPKQPAGTTLAAARGVTRDLAMSSPRTWSWPATLDL